MKTTRSVKFGLFGVCIGLAAVAVGRAQTTEVVLHNFETPPNGAFPGASVIRDTPGNLYGTTINGGASNAGVVFKLDTTGHQTVLYSFTGGADGGIPYAGVIRDPAGNLYGTTAQAGALGWGVVFKLDTTGHETVLYTFTGGADGADPLAGVILDSAGNLYGTTYQGGAANAGVVFKLDTTGHETVLYSFCTLSGCADGDFPNAGVIRDTAGNLYGTTTDGGASGFGVVFKLDTTSHETVLHSFTGGTDGGQPYAGVIRDPAGNLYGTTNIGGASSCLPNGCGMVFKLSTTGHETVLHSFTGGADGGFPRAAVIRDTAGNLYGTTAYGGASNVGVIFKLDTTGHETVLYSLTGADGDKPLAGVIRDTAGNLYGTTQAGGASNLGVVFKVDTTDHETVVYSFPGGADGDPYSSVVRDTAGNLYGTTVNGGAAGKGVVFKLDTTGHETVVYTFTGGADGGVPYAGVIRDSAGNLYGTTTAGGTSGKGVVFKVDSTGLETVLYSFTGGADGSSPYAGVVRDTAGNLYGTTYYGGASNGAQQRAPTAAYAPNGPAHCCAELRLFTQQHELETV